MSPAIKVCGLEKVPPSAAPLHLAIGMFDGVHLGHQSVIGAAVHSARSNGGTAGAVTFWPHPSRLFRPEQAVPQITSPNIKARLLERFGVELIIEQMFDAEFAAIPAEEFVTTLRRHLPALAAIYVGENWRFGKGRKGDIQLLVDLSKAAGIALVSCPRLRRDGEAISSTRIRNLLSDGAIRQANALLGYTYFSEGVVQEGRRLGRQLGFPTLNLPWSPELKPRFGVYAVRASGKDGGNFDGVANYGIRPTVDRVPEQDPLLEVHLFGNSCPFSPGHQLRVEWLEFLRPEKRFADLEELKAQIAIDVSRASAVLR